MQDRVYSLGTKSQSRPHKDRQLDPYQYLQDCCSMTPCDRFYDSRLINRYGTTIETKCALGRTPNVKSRAVVSGIASMALSQLSICGWPYGTSPQVGSLLLAIVSFEAPGFEPRAGFKNNNAILVKRILRHSQYFTYIFSPATQG